MSSITFILHKPQLSENIGACARAIKNFNFNKLAVINPLLRKEIYEEKKKIKNKIKKKFTILIIGGSQGSEFFDNEISELMINFSKNYKISLIQQITDENKKK